MSIDIEVERSRFEDWMRSNDMEVGDRFGLVYSKLSTQLSFGTWLAAKRDAEKEST